MLSSVEVVGRIVGCLDVVQLLDGAAQRVGACISTRMIQCGQRMHVHTAMHLQLLQMAYRT